MKLRLGFAACLAAAGCGNISSDEASDLRVPAAVQSMINASHLDGRQAYIQQRGKFEITEKTLICGLPNEVDPKIHTITGKKAGAQGAIDLDGALQELGQTSYVGGTTRYRPVNSQECSDLRHVRVRWAEKLNRHGKPYRLVLAVWQSDAAWVGILERDGRRLDSSVPFKPPAFGDGPCCEPGNSLSLDYAELSKRFSEFLIGERP